MYARSTYVPALTALTLILAVGTSSSVSAQTPVQRDLASVLAQSVRDTNLVSPISGARLSTSAVRVAVEMLEHGTGNAHDRVADALSRSGASAVTVDRLLRTLTQLWALPTSAHLVDAESSFNAFVDTSSQRFIDDPPQEFLALRAILLRVVTAAHDPTT